MIVLLILASCTSPDPKLYTLATTDGPTVAAAGVIELRHVAIPGYADRPEIVRSAAEYRVHLASNERWGEPLGDLVQSVLGADLQKRLPQATVFSDDGPISAPASRIVEVDLARFESDGAGQVMLDAQLSLRATGDAGSLATRAVHLTAPIAGAATADYVAAMSAALGQLADAIAAACMASQVGG